MEEGKGIGERKKGWRINKKVNIEGEEIKIDLERKKINEMKEKWRGNVRVNN